jgi:hypothetical protein
MRTQRQKRIGELSQIEYSKRELPSFLTEVGKALGMPLSNNSVLPLDMSEQTLVKLDTHIKASLDVAPGDEHLVFPSSARSIFDAELAKRMQAFGAENVVLSLGRFHDLPLLQVQSSLVSDHFYDLWRVGDTVAICSADASQGVMADWYPDDLEQSFELAGWGVS